MKVTETAQSKRKHHTVEVDGIPYFRNEYFEFNFEKNKWVRSQTFFGFWKYRKL